MSLSPAIEKKRRIISVDASAAFTTAATDDGFSACLPLREFLEKRDFAGAIAWAKQNCVSAVSKDAVAAVLSRRVLDFGDFNALTVAQSIGLHLPQKRIVIAGSGSHPLEFALARRLIAAGDGLVLHLVDSASAISGSTGNEDLVHNPFYQVKSIDLIREFEVEGPVQIVYLFPTVYSIKAVQDTESMTDRTAMRLPLIAERVIEFARRNYSRLIFVSSVLIYGDPFDSHATLALSAIKASVETGIPEEFRGYTSTTGPIAPLSETIRTVEAWVSVANRELKVDTIIARIGTVVGKQAIAQESSTIGDLFTSIIHAIKTGEKVVKVGVPAYETARNVAILDINAAADALQLMIEYPVIDDPKKTMELNFERFRVFNVSNVQNSTVDDIISAASQVLQKHGKSISFQLENLPEILGFCDPSFVVQTSSRLARTFPAWKANETPAQLFASILENHLSSAVVTSSTTNGNGTHTISSAYQHSVVIQAEEPTNPSTPLMRSIDAELKFKFFIGPIRQPDGSVRFPGVGKLKINPEKKGVVFITGGAGFLASNLIGKLLREGFQVISVDNLAAGVKENLSQYLDDPRFWEDFQFIQFDVSNPFIVSDEVPVKIVYHGASLASPEFYYKDMVGTLRCGIDGSIFALELAKQMNARFVFTSTSEVYGDPFNHPQQKAYLGNVNTTGKRCQYDQSKRFGETLADSYFRRGLDVRILRIFNTYGPLMRPDDGRVVTNFIHQALIGSPMTIYGSGRQTRSFLFVNDQVDGQYRLLTFEGEFKGPNLIDRTFNVGNDEYEIDMNILADIVKNVIHRMTGRDVKVAHVNWTQIRDRGLTKEQANTKAAEYNKELKEKVAKQAAEGGKNRDDADHDVQYISVPEFEGSDSYLVVRDEYDKFDPQRRRADASDAHDPTLLGWKGAVTPLTHGIERLVQFFIANPRVLRGIDRVLKPYDYEAIMQRHGLGIRGEYVTERYLEAAGFNKCESEVPVFDEAEAHFLAHHLTRHALVSKPLEGAPEGITWVSVAKSIEENIVMPEKVRQILLAPLNA